MAGISKPRMLVILANAIAQAEVDGLARVYIQALRDIEDILLGNTPMAAHSFWQAIIAKSDRRHCGGFAAMPPERLREVSAHGRGNFTVNKLGAIEAGKKGGLARAANTTPKQRSEWSARGAEVTNSKRRR